MCSPQHSHDASSPSPQKAQTKRKYGTIQRDTVAYRLPVS
jgi:hypothetical protein